jgi:hypothetical protein
MTNNQKQNKSKRSRQGVGAIMGGVILVSILVTTVLLYYVSILDNDQRKASYEIQSAQNDMNKASENLAAYRDRDLAVVGPDSYVNTFMSNDGSLPLIVTHTLLYCVDPTCPASDPVISEAPMTLNGKEQANTQVGPVSNGLTYRVDFITERGNIVSTPECDVDLAQGICTNDPGTGTTPDFLLTVSPNAVVIDHGNSGGTTVTVTSLNDFTDPVQVVVTGMPAGVTVSPVSNTVTPPSGSSIDYPLTITVSPTVATGTYTLTLTGTSTSITHTTRMSLTIIKVPTLDDLNLDPRLIQQPQIQPIFPNPFGKTTGNKALWGAVIANPSEHPMTVRKLVISIYDPAQKGDSFCGTLTVVTPSSPTGVPPSAGNWSCVGGAGTFNVLEWKTSGAPISIPAFSGRTFLVQMGDPAPTPANPSGNRPSLAVNYNVYTDYGQFTKVGYDMGMRAESGSHPIVNAFLSTGIADKTASNVMGVINAQASVPITVRASIANYVPGTTVDAGARLIVDLPRNFVVSGWTQPTGFDACSPVVYSDGSTQINCSLTSALNGNSPNDVRTIQFTMTPPPHTSTKLYVLHVLGDGTSEGNTFTVGPVAENVIVVTP